MHHAEILAGQARHGAMLAAILELLHRGRGARDAADAALLVAIAEAIGDRVFTCAELFVHVAVAPALQAALEAADITTPRELGKLCSRLENAVVRGLHLERTAESRAGVLWRVRVSESQTRAE